MIAPSSPRIAYLDACRALAVLAMLYANLVNVFLGNVPRLLEHNAGDVLRVFDLPAPAFQFLVGVSLVPFLAAQRAAGRSEIRARGAAVRRFVLLMVLGMVLDGIGTLRLEPQWGVLQTLGVGGLVATALAGRSDATVAAVGLALLGVSSLVPDAEVHHHPGAALAFVPLTLGGLLVGRGFGGARHAVMRRALAVGAVGVLVAAIAWAGGVPFNKVHGTASFTALTTALSAGVLLVLAVAEETGRRFPAWLLVVGGNALTAWVLQYVLVYYPAWLVFPTWERLALVPGLLSATTTVMALSALTVVLARRGVRVPI